MQELNPLCGVDEKIGASGVWPKTRDLPRIGLVPAELVSEDTGSSLEIITGVDLVALDGERELVLHRYSPGKDTTVFVGGLGERSHRGLNRNSLAVTDEWVGRSDTHTSVLFLEALGTVLRNL